MVASSVILQNTVDMMRILQKLAREGWQFNDEDVSFLSPYLTSNVKRFGEFNLKLNRRSEEHTSELQSLMRISYAVFCLKKKKTPHISSKQIRQIRNTA